VSQESRQQVTLAKIYAMFEASAATCWQIESGGHSGSRQDPIWLARKPNGIYAVSAPNEFHAINSSSSAYFSFGEALSKKWKRV